MQGISDESFIKTQGKGKQLNKLIPHPYTNNYLGKCNLCMDRTSDRSRLSCNHCTRWYREMSFRFLSYVSRSQTVLIKSDIYGSILPYECLFVYSQRWFSVISSVHKNLFILMYFLPACVSGPPSFRSLWTWKWGLRLLDIEILRWYHGEISPLIGGWLAMRTVRLVIIPLDAKLP